MLLSTGVLTLPMSVSYLDNVEACLVQYLREKGKLSSEFPTSIQACDHCKEQFPNLYGDLQAVMISDLKCKALDADCIVNVADELRTVDHLLTIYALRLNKILSPSKLKEKLNSTRQLLRNDMDKMSLQCESDLADLHNVRIFAASLNARNGTVEGMKHDYCIAKYAVDYGFLSKGNYELFQNNITNDDIDCAPIILEDQQNTEQVFKDQTFDEKDSEAAKTCMMQAFVELKRYGWSTALIVLSYEEHSRQTNEMDTIKVTNTLLDPEFSKVIEGCRNVDSAIVTAAV